MNLWLFTTSIKVSLSMVQVAYGKSVWLKSLILWEPADRRACQGGRRESEVEAIDRVTFYFERWWYWEGWHSPAILLAYIHFCYWKRRKRWLQTSTTRTYPRRRSTGWPSSTSPSVCNAKPASVRPTRVHSKTMPTNPSSRTISATRSATS